MAVIEMERVGTETVNAQISAEILAEAIRIAEEKRLAKEAEQKHIEQEEQKISIAQAYELYITDDVEGKGKAPDTIKNWRDVKKYTVMFWTEDRDKDGIELGRKVKYIQDLTLDDIRDFNKYLTKKRNHRGNIIQQDTRRRYLTYLRKVLEWCDLQDYKVIKPKLIGLPQHQKRNPRFLTIDEFIEFMEAVGRRRENVREIVRLRNIAICLVFFSSGVRLTELRSMNRNDIKDCQFLVEAIHTKSRDARMAFLSKAAMHAIDAYLSMRRDKNPALFVSTQRPDRLSESAVEHIFQQARAECSGKVRKTSPHTLRHTFATYCYSRKVEIYVISKLLGHVNLSTTQIYTHLGDPDLKEEHKRVMNRGPVMRFSFA